jgi:hypothetical protein
VTRTSFVLYSSRNTKPSAAMNKSPLRVPFIRGAAGAEVWEGSGMSLD